MKRKNLKSLVVLLTTQAVCAAVFFCVPANAGTPGAASASFLKFTPSPRATGMGDSYISITEDAYAAYWNPAGLASLELPELAATYNASFQDVSHQYVSFAYPLRFGSTAGINFTRLSVAPFQGYDAAGYRIGKVESSDLAIGAAYARALYKDEIERPVLNVGANLKSVNETLDKASASTFALDLGAIYYLRPAHYWMQKVPAQEFRFAATIKNLGPGLTFDKVSSPLPLAFTMGASWHSHPGGSASLILSMDQTISNDEKYLINLGAEYTAFQLLAFRAGYKTGQAIGTGVRIGVGFKLSVMDLDYSMSPFGDLGFMHKIGISMKFGQGQAKAPLSGKIQRVEKAKLIAPKEKIEKLEMFANDFIELAKKDLEARKYISADANISKAFNLDPDLKNGEWGSKQQRLATIIKELRLKDTQGLENIFSRNNEQANTADEAVISYVNGNDLKAFLLAHAAWGANLRGDPVFEELLYKLGEVTRNNIRRDEILPKQALIKEKLRKAAKFFYIQQFDMAAKECEEAVLLEEKNPIGWTRMGSAYFMLGDREKAKKAYLKALEVNPNDQVTRQFMESQGWK